MLKPFEKNKSFIGTRDRIGNGSALVPLSRPTEKSALTGFICYIGIGSNLGNRRKNIRLAIDRISRIKDTRVTKVSSIIETLPVGGPPQGKYLNAAIEIRTALSPRELLNNLQNIESALGRVRCQEYGPRTIDLDILVFENEKMKEKDLIVPHHKILEREFVLVPLKEIAPHIVEKLLNEDNQKN